MGCRHHRNRNGEVEAAADALCADLPEVAEDVVADIMRRRRRERDLIPVGTISVDCTPVSFATRGQVRNVVSCAVSEIVEVPICQTSFVETPGPLGCSIFQPVTQQVNVPVVTTVNIPPVLVPFPRIVCPPGVTEAVQAASECP